MTPTRMETCEWPWLKVPSAEKLAILEWSKRKKPLNIDHSLVETWSRRQAGGRAPCGELRTPVTNVTYLHTCARGGQEHPTGTGGCGDQTSPLRRGRAVATGGAEMSTVDRRGESGVHVGRSGCEYPPRR